MDLLLFSVSKSISNQSLRMPKTSGLARAADETEAVAAWGFVRRANFHRAGLCPAGAGEKATRI